MSDMGDISNVFASGPVDLDWLSVDEEEYRKEQALPKQNLDITPDLKALWNHEDKDPKTYFTPNRDLASYPVDPKIPQAPATMGDLSQLHGPISAEVTKVARLALMQHTSLDRWREAVTVKFDKTTLINNKTALASVIAERGLLGKLYVSASDFPKCAQTRTAAAFVRKYAAEAPFLVAKEACGDCCHKQKTVDGAERCGVFHKQLVPEVPYNEQVANHIESQQQAKGCQVQASDGADPKTRIKAAFLAERVDAPQSKYSGQYNTGAVIPAERLLKKVASADVIQSQKEALDARKAAPIVAHFKRELLKGRGIQDILHAVRYAFDLNDLKATKAHWEPLVREAGLYGSVYSTQDSFDSCHEGADFLSKHGSKVRAIVASEKCNSCIYNKISSCMLYGRKLVASAEELYTPEVVAAVLDEHKMVGSISPVAAKQPWGDTPKAALKAMHKAASTLAPQSAPSGLHISYQQAFHGESVAHRTRENTKASILKAAAQFLNEGLYGSELETCLRAKFDPRDLVACAQPLQAVIAEQGLQGIQYVDPSVYDDYGHGCKTAQGMFRSKGSIKYAKVGDKCASCVHQSIPGRCSALNKSLVVEPPYIDKAAQQQAVLASGRATEIDYGSLVNNGHSMLEEYEMVSGGLSLVDLNPAAPELVSSIEFGNNDIDVTKL